MMKKNLSIIKALLIVSTIVPLYQNCGRLKSSGTNGSFSSVEARNSEFDYKVYDQAFEEIVDQIPIFYAGKKYNFRINLEKLEGALIFWDLIYLGASCDLKVLTSKEFAELQCFSHGQIGVSVTAVYPDATEKYGEIIGFVYDSPGNVGEGSYITPITVNITSSGNTTNWAIQNAPNDHNSVNIVSGSGATRSVIVYLKQPIRIINQNTELHKPGGAVPGVPCKSAPFPLQKDQSFDCITDSPLPEGKHIIDENDNTAGGRFNFRVVDSKAVWVNNNCAGCHNNIQQPFPTGSSPNDLLNKLNSAIMNADGMDIYSTMSAEDRRALAFYMFYRP